MVPARCLERHDVLGEGEILQSAWAQPLAAPFLAAPPAPPPCAAPPADATRGRGHGRGRGPAKGRVARGSFPLCVEATAKEAGEQSATGEDRTENMRQKTKHNINRHQNWWLEIM